eukprot:Colp12_sorted_trinity150504_noHs@34284
MALAIARARLAVHPQTFARVAAVFTRRFATEGDAGAVKFDFSVPYKLHKLPENEGPKNYAYATKEELLSYFRTMTVVRRMETAAGDLYKSKYIRGFCHLYSGQEAVCTGIEAAIDKDDSIITAYRAHGFTYVRGVPVAGVLSELTGREVGCAKGKGGSMHMYHHEFYGGNGIVGAQVPLGVGIAFAHKYRKRPNIAIALYGDGAANQGQIFEAFNMAKLWDIPCIFICENNKYGMGTSILRSSASSQYYTRGDFISGIKVNGMDVLAVREAIAFGKEWCLSGKGPLVMEMETYRYGGHSMSDPGTSYRTRDEIKTMRDQFDPITSVRDRILSSNLATAEELKEIEKGVREEVDAAVEVAKTAKELPIEETFTHVYTKEENSVIRGTHAYDWHYPKY